MLNYYGIKDSCLLCDGNPWYDWQFLAPHCKCKRKPCDHKEEKELNTPEQDDQEPKDPCCKDDCCGFPCCGNPCCKKPCPCIKKANELEELLKDLKSDVARNTLTIKNNYDYFSELISDLAIKELKDVDDLWAALRQEIVDRTNGDNALWNALNQEIADRTAADAAEQAAREQADADEAAAREAADTTLLNNIDNVQDALEAEVNRSTAMDILLGQDIAEVSDRLNDALGIDAQGLEAIIRVLEDHDTATGIAVLIGDLYTNKKDKLTAVSDPISSGNTLNFIDTISQNTNGDITVTKKKLQYSEAYVDAQHQGKDGIITAQEKARLDNAKQLQTAVSDPSVPSTGTTESISFIDTITLNTNGDITPTKKEVRYATTSAKGVVTLADSISSSDTTAATPGAVEDYVSDTVSGLDAAITSSDGTNVLVKVTETDGKITGVNITTDNTINATDLSNAINALDASITGRGTNVDVTVTETNGKISGVTVSDNSINSTDLTNALGGYKTLQTAETDPTSTDIITIGSDSENNEVSSVDVITNITQNANGVITATKKTIDFSGLLTRIDNIETAISNINSAIATLQGYWRETEWYTTGNNVKVYKLTTPYVIEPEGYR